jgi:excisionase family DNA binding protein
MIRLEAGTYITPKEYAKKANLTVQAVYRAVREGRLKGYRVDNAILIKSDSLIQNRTKRSGIYVGFRALQRGDVQEFLRLRGIEAKEESED